VGARVSAPSTAFLLHPASALHDTGWGHPEHQGRLRALVSAVEKDSVALHRRVQQVDPVEADPSVLTAVHPKAHVDLVREAAQAAAAGAGRVALDPDTQVSAASWDAALGNVGAAITAARLVSEGSFRNAFVATRPPGHHATPDRAMGFCLFNNVAVLARWLQRQGKAERVLIVDWDVHHGNGTQDVFWEDPSVFFLSLHQYPWYPGTGRADDVGAGAGRGYTLNVPLPAGTPPDEYFRRYGEALDAVMTKFSPDFVLVSSGFDVLAGDPLGGQLLEPEDMHELTRRVMARADEQCGGRVVVLLEGGYEVGRTGLGAVAVMRALSGVEEPDPTVKSSDG
jgi:acetoin utilization deacetylase AcuC-like enzyme